MLISAGSFNLKQRRFAGDFSLRPIMKLGFSSTGDASGRRQLRVGGILAAVSLAFAVSGVMVWRHRHALSILPGLPLPATGHIGHQYPDPPGILIHHSDTPAKSGNVTFNAAALDRIAKQRGFSVTFEGHIYHISYHYVILPDGTIETGRPDHCQGAHCPKFNNWLGICLIGDFHNHRKWWPSDPTAAQKNSLVSLCESLMSKYHIAPENVRRHRDVHETWCPGNRFPYGEIISKLNAYSVIHPETLTSAHLAPITPAPETMPTVAAPEVAPVKNAPTKK